MSSYETSATAINIFDGMGISGDSKRYDKMATVWGNNGMGFIEFCMWLGKLAKHSTSYVESLDPVNYPGVYDYEVSYTIGEMIYAYMDTKQKMPSTSEVKRWIQTEAVKFFKQGATA